MPSAHHGPRHRVYRKDGRVESTTSYRWLPAVMMCFVPERAAPPVPEESCLVHALTKRPHACWPQSPPGNNSRQGYDGIIYLEGTGGSIILRMHNNIKRAHTFVSVIHSSYRYIDNKPASKGLQNKTKPPTHPPSTHPLPPTPEIDPALQQHFLRNSPVSIEVSK